MKIVVPSSTGGATDTFSRALGPRLTEIWGQNAVVCVDCVSVCVSIGSLWEFDWVFGLDRWDIEGVVWIVGV